ncbi:MAG: ribokinase [Tabrizicola sp.]|nr:ribokinase [Tabrizicola sp.]
MSRIVVLGVYVADATFRAERQPRLGETVLGQSFALRSGGKGSNQAVAAAMAGGDVHFISRLGEDAFAAMAHDLWGAAGVTPAITVDPTSYTGAANIYVDATSGNNAIIICPGAAEQITPADIDARADLIAGAKVAVTQLEQPMAAAGRFLEVARAGGVVTILNPAPAAALPDDMLALCDFVTPNESEAEALTGIAVVTLEDARRAADKLMAKGVGAVVITLGERGVLYQSRKEWVHVPAFNAGPVVETTGAGDAFNGGFSVAIAEGKSPLEAVQFGCAVASISVTRAGAAAAMPTRSEVLQLLGSKRG